MADGTSRPQGRKVFFEEQSLESCIGSGAWRKPRIGCDAIASDQVRVKRRGKSSPQDWRQDWHGKPHPGQGQIGVDQRNDCPVAARLRDRTRLIGGLPNPSESCFSIYIFRLRSFSSPLASVLVVLSERTIPQHFLQTPVLKGNPPSSSLDRLFLSI
jgi:hypothetical protein